MSAENDREFLDLSTLLGESPEKLSIDQVLGAMSVYFWWDNDMTSPETYIIPVLGEANSAQCTAIMNALYAQFRPQVDDRDPPVSGIQHFTDYVRKGESAVPNSVIAAHEFTLQRAIRWLTSIQKDAQPPSETAIKTPGNSTDEDWFDLTPMLTLFQDWTVRSLMDNGMSVDEASYALHVLDLEETRRMGAADPAQQAYDAHRESGQSYQQFIQTYMVQHMLEPATFSELLEDYEDIPEDAIDWPIDIKRAFIKRYLAEINDTLELFETNYQKRVHGILPAYIHSYYDW